MIDMLPVKLAALPGVNVAVKLMFWPAAIVCPAESPVMLYPAPLVVACEIVMADVPVLDSVICWLVVWPTPMFPKATDRGEIAKTGCVPAPVNEIEIEGFVALLATVIVALAAPTACGAY